MRTFVANSKMPPALIARIERSVARSHRGARSERFAAASRISLTGAIPMVAMGAALVMLALFLIARRQERQQIESARAALLGKARSESAWITKQVEDFLPKTAGWVRRLGLAYEGDLIAPELHEARGLSAQLERPGIYVRAVVDDLVSEDRLESAAAASIKDSFLLCLYERPESRAEAVLLAKLRGVNPGGALVDRRTANVYRLHDAQAGMHVLQGQWKRQVETAAQLKDVIKLTTEFERAPIEKARQAAFAEVLIAVLDEPGSGGPSDLDSERPHDARVALVDLRANKLLLQIRRRVDPAWLSPATRSLFARGLDGCALAIDVHDAVRAGG